MSVERRLRAALALLGTAALSMFVLVTPAWAHDALVSSTPAASQTVPRVPAAVALTFEERPLSMGLQVVVTGPNGPVQQGAPQLKEDVVTQALRAGAPKGDYTVDWRVTADDGHPVSGSLTFTAQAAGSDAPASSGAAEGTPSGTPSGSSGGSSGAMWLVVGLAAAASVASLLWRRSRDRRSSEFASRSARIR